MWGRNQRDTLRSRVAHHRNVKFLTEPQLRAFLNHGLRGNAALLTASSYPDRDYAYGLTLVSSGMRRAEEQSSSTSNSRRHTPSLPAASSRSLRGP